jgi:hypothetical protein
MVVHACGVHFVHDDVGASAFVRFPFFSSSRPPPFVRSCRLDAAVSWLFSFSSSPLSLVATSRLCYRLLCFYANGVGCSAAFPFTARSSFCALLSPLSLCRACPSFACAHPYSFTAPRFRVCLIARGALLLADGQHVMRVCAVHLVVVYTCDLRG